MATWTKKNPSHSQVPPEGNLDYFGIRKTGEEIELICPKGWIGHMPYGKKELAQVKEWWVGRQERLQREFEERYVGVLVGRSPIHQRFEDSSKKFLIPVRIYF